MGIKDKFSGSPFIVVGTKHYDCTHGIDHAKSRKEKNHLEKIKEKVYYYYYIIYNAYFT